MMLMFTKLERLVITMIGWIIGIVLAVVLGLWLAFSAAGVVLHVLGWILLIAAVIGIFKLATRGSAP